jgi:hypothetical protein
VFFNFTVVAERAGIPVVRNGLTSAEFNIFNGAAWIAVSRVSDAVVP